jgi:putative ABC transport system ATP-binding protein
MNGAPAIDARKLTRDYRRGSEIVAALRGVDLRVEQGERVAIMGPSGCGKTTLLGLIGGLDRPTSGTVELCGNDVGGASQRVLALLRRRTVGFVLQTPSLLPMLTVRENVELPLSLDGLGARERYKRAMELLELVELPEKADALPEELSGGQQQRASIARTLAPRPKVILADEPAGSLDSATAEVILTLITRSVKEAGITFVMVTHEAEDSRYADRVVRLADGLIVNSGQDR